MYHRRSKRKYLTPVGAPPSGRVYNLMFTFVSAHLYLEYSIHCARNGHHYIIRSLKGKEHCRLFLIYRINSGTYVCTYFNELERVMTQHKFSRHQDVIFWLIGVQNGKNI